MNLSVNGQSQVPPGFRFHPTEEELLQYYLKKKVASQKIDLDVIRDIDLNKLEPWDIQEKCRIGSGPQNDWYFFSHKDKKYPTGTRTNRATAAGFWKATGRDKMIYGNNQRLGMRKTLVFYKGRAPHGEKSEWIMHEYRLQDCTTSTLHDFPNVVSSSSQDQCMTEEGWVICRVFRKKNYQKTNDSPKSLPTRATTSDPQTQFLDYSSKKVLDHIFSCIGKTSYHQDDINNNHDRPTTSCSTGTISNIIPVTYSCSTDNHNHNHDINSASNDHQFVLNSQLAATDDYHNCDLPMLICSSSSPSFDHDDDPIMNSICFDHQRLYDDDDDKARLSDWMTLDRLIASQLNGQDQDFDL